MVTLSLGNKKRTFRSIREASDVSGIPYMTLYQRLRHGQKPSVALSKVVRKYVKK